MQRERTAGPLYAAPTVTREEILHDGCLFPDQNTETGGPWPPVLFS